MKFNDGRKHRFSEYPSKMVSSILNFSALHVSCLKSSGIIYTNIVNSKYLGLYSRHYTYKNG